MKKIVASMMLGTMIISTASMSFANAKPMEKIAMEDLNVASYEETYEGDFDDFDDFEYEAETFTEFMGDFLAKVSSEDKDLMEKHFDAAVELEEAEKWEDAEKEWLAFDKVMEKYEKEFDTYLIDSMPSFDELVKEYSDMLKPVDDASMDKLEGLYKDALALEKEAKYEAADEKWEAFYTLAEGFIKEEFLDDVDGSFEDEDYDDEDFEDLSFDDLLKEYSDMLKPVDDASMAKLEALYNDALALEEDEKYEDAEEKWEAFDTLAETFIKEEFLDDFNADLDEEDYDDADFEMPTFEEFMEESSEWLKAIPKDDMNKLETLFNKGVKLEEEGKYEEADKEWIAFDKLLESYEK